MSTTNISSGTTASIGLNNNDTLNVLNGGSIVTGTAVKWQGGSTSSSLATINNSGTISGTSRAIDTGNSFTGSGGLTVNNVSGASITAVNDAIRINGDVTSGTITVVNGGIIQSTGSSGNGGQALDFDAISSTNAHVFITNQATGVISAADADAIRPGTNATIVNLGKIVAGTPVTSVGNATGNDAIDYKTHTGVVISNGDAGHTSASITGARHGITGSTPSTITNYGVITGKDGSGINLDTSSTTTATITNYGTIIGNAVSADGDGVDVDGLAAINNSGTISGAGTHISGDLQEAVTIGGGTINNFAGGTIRSFERAITVDDSNGGNAFGSTTIVNAGTIQGDNGQAIVITDTFADAITNQGTIIGLVSMGGGNDAFTAQAGSVVSGGIYLGDGDNTYAGADHAETVYGCVGNDTYYVNNGGDVVVENAGEGTDVVYASVDYALTSGSAIEQLRANAGSTGLHLTGNELANTIVGGAGNDVLSGGGGNDTIDAGAGSGDKVIYAGNRSDYSIVYNGGSSYTVTDLRGGSPDGTDTVVNTEQLQFADTLVAICFMAGTRVLTPAGERAVETLVAGDLVLTAEGEVRPVRWLGRQTISTRFADPLRALPIRIRKDALADAVPARDLLISPDHALRINDILVQAAALVNGVSITRETDVPEVFVYYHVELDDHSLILAENTPAETFIDNVDRLAFDNWPEHEALYPEGKPIVEMPYPRAKAHRQVPRSVRDQLVARSAALYGAKTAAA
jgi:hypothetical protein